MSTLAFMDAGGILEALLRSSLQGALFIAAVWLACRLFPCLPASVRCGLWWAACLKLLVGLVWIAPVRLPLLPAERVEAEVRMGEAVGVVTRPAQSLVPAPGRVEPPGHRPDPPLPEALVATWLAGLLLVMARSARQLRHTRWVIRRAKPVREGWIRTVLAELCARLALRRPPELLGSGDVKTPQAVGLLRPRIVLPQSGLARLSPPEISMTLCHELLHLRRGDLWFGWVPALAQRIFYFHPLAALAAREYAIAREAACDAAVLRVLGTAPQDYGRLLLRWGVAPRETGLAAAGASPSLKNLKRRLQMLQQTSDFRRRPSGWWWLAGAAVLAGVIPLQIVAQEPASEAEPEPAVEAVVAPEAIPALPPAAVVTPKPPAVATPAVASTPAIAPTPTPYPTPAVAPAPPSGSIPGGVEGGVPGGIEGGIVGGVEGGVEGGVRGGIVGGVVGGVPGAIAPTPATPAAPSPIPRPALAPSARPPLPGRAPRALPPPGRGPVVAPPSAAPVARATPVAAPGHAPAHQAPPPAPPAPPKPPTPPVPPKASGFSYQFGDGEAWVLLHGDGSSSMSGSGRDITEAKRLRGSSQDEILYFRRGEKAYVIRDPAVLAEAAKLWKPVGELGRRQGELGAQQGRLGAKQGELGAKQGALGAQMGALGARQARSRDDAEDREIAERGEELARQQEALGRQQEELGRQQEALGRQQEELGRQQEAAGRKAKAAMTDLMDRAMRSGAAQEVK